MDLIAQTVIPRHGVARNADGLSFMQAALLGASTPLTLASAPTGAGKSYVYRRAVQRGERVLFVVPTRRLAQNQTEALRGEFRRDGWPEADLLEKIACWTADTAAAMREQGIDVRIHRLSRLPHLRPGEKGEIIFIIPETLSFLLFAPAIGDGLGDVGPETLMGAFDRIVFDEFHLIQARGFGLVSLCVGLIINGPWGKEVPDGLARARVSLLSATPIDVRPVLARLGLSLSADSLIIETILDAEHLGPNDRSLHGDVTVEFVQADSPLDLLREIQSEITALPPGQSALVLYDALKDLQRDVKSLHQVAEALGLLSTDSFLVDSSIDGQREDRWCGRGKSLDNRRLIAATSTVEVGVTIPGLSLLIMDPGFSPLSFMQRLGRVARGDLSGRVIVRLGRGMTSERPWLKRLLDHVVGSGGRLPIGALSAFLCDGLPERFSLPETPEMENLWRNKEPPEIGDSMAFFAALPLRAALAAGVYWTLLEDRLRERGLTAKAVALRAAAPVTARLARSWLDEVSTGPLRSEGGCLWRQAFESQARILRDFSPTVVVIGIEGQRFEVSEAWLTRHTTLLEEFPVTQDAEGRTLLQVDDARSWGEALRQDGERSGDYRRSALLPYRKREVLLGRAPIEEYVQALDVLQRDLGGSRKMRAAVAAAGRLVSATGIVPYVENGLGLSGAGSGIL